ncbi:MAG: hypothetical protein WCI30_04690 [Clostridia bacterium]
MYLGIIAGSKVKPQIMETKDYKNGDILLVQIKDAKKPICRKVLFIDVDNTKLALMAYDQQFDTDTYIIKKFIF